LLFWDVLKAFIIFWKKLAKCMHSVETHVLKNGELLKRKNEFCCSFLLLLLLLLFSSLGLQILEQNSSVESCRQLSCCRVSLILEKRRFGCFN
jgi:hypothetical protein